MRGRTLWAEAARSVVSAWIPSLLVGLVTGMICFAALGTVGRTAAAADEMTRRLEDAGARVLTVTDTDNDEVINVRTVQAIRGLSEVSAASAVTMPTDATNGVIGPGGTRVPLWIALDETSVRQCGQIIDGRPPRSGEAVVSHTARRALGFDSSAGWVVTTAGRSYPVVGTMRANALCHDLSTGVLVLGTDSQKVGAELRVQLARVDASGVGVRDVMAVLAPRHPEKLAVDSPTALAVTAQQLQSDLARGGRSQLLLILAIGGAVVAAVVLADVILHRRDLGRRRTLGITRADLVSLVCLRVAMTAFCGALTGSLAGYLMSVVSHHVVPWTFTAAVLFLALVAAVVSAVAPAVFAATRDPVRVMRTP